MVDLTKKPFNLNDEQIKWVTTTKNNMSIEEKIGQLFFMIGMDPRPEVLDMTLAIKPGGVMFRPMPREVIKNAHQYLQSKSEIPLFLAANLESGADGLISEGTHVGNNMLIAATDNPRNAYHQGRICIEEALEVGGNMAFAPVIDINYNFDNPITNTRSYGDKVERISSMGKEYIRGVQEQGGSVTIKHFPGDGCDGRDQHLAITVNNLSWNDWQQTYGKIYQETIDAGATGMMVGHIALPSYFHENKISDESSNIPASLSKNLITGLVREQLGFNGLIMTDATLMAGFGSYGKREDLVPQSIAAGNDMFLFTKNTEEDFKFMMQGYKQGIITEERLDDALTRILGLKAVQKMNEKQSLFKPLNEGLITANQSLARSIADEAVTLVKDEAQILPINVKKTPKIGIIDFARQSMTDSDTKTATDYFRAELITNGFDVVDLEFGCGFENVEKMMEIYLMSVEELKAKADIFIYVTSILPASNATSIRINYKSFAGLDAPWFVHEVPTMYVSFGNPYHGYDFSEIKTGINAYSTSPTVVQKTVEKMLGKSQFKGKSPVKLDFKPFTGNITPWQ